MAVLPIWAAKAGSFLAKKGVQALKTGFSAKSGAASISYTPPQVTAGKTASSPTGASGGIMDMLKNPVVLGGIGLAVFLMLKK
jgi:hypothetical protein